MLPSRRWSTFVGQEQQQAHPIRQMKIVEQGLPVLPNRRWRIGLQVLVLVHPIHHWKISEQREQVLPSCPLKRFELRVQRPIHRTCFVEQVPVERPKEAPTPFAREAFAVHVGIWRMWQWLRSWECH